MPDKSASSVWATRDDCWDDFLNDPVLNQELELARAQKAGLYKSSKPELEKGELSGTDARGNPQPVEEQPVMPTEDSIGSRLRAYETPITEEILRQSID